MSRSWLAVGLTLLFACDLTDPTDELQLDSEQQAIFNGAPTSGDDATAFIVMTRQQDGQRRIVSTCTATLVTESNAMGVTSSKTLASARHCPRSGGGIPQLGIPAGYVYPPEDILVFFGQNFSGNLAINNAYRVVAHDLHPDSDLAMLAMAEPGPAMPIQLWNQPIEPGMPARVAGFGRNNDAQNGSGVKYSGSTTIVAADTEGVISHLSNVGVDFPAGTAARIEGQQGRLLFIGNPPGQTQNANHCQGDSGGPTFVSVNGQDFLAGVNSIGFGASDPDIRRPNCADQTTTSGSVRVDQYNDWMASFIRQHNGPPPGGVGAGPAGPGPDQGGGIGGAFSDVFGGCSSGGQGGAWTFCFLALALIRRRK